jgi:outer membrane protein assembly factor BamB
MSIAQTVESTPRKPLRLWPGVVAAVLLLLFRFGLPVVAPEAQFFGMEANLFGFIASAVCALAILVWWLLFSRAPWSERLGALVLMVVALWATSRLVHESIAGAGMGWLLYVLAIPVMSLALVPWAVASRGLSSGLRRASMAATILFACGLFTLVRTGGSTSDIMGSEFHWRWTPTPEERLLAQAADTPPPAPAAETPKELPVAEAPGGPAASRTTPSTAKIEPTAPAAAETAGGPAMSERGFKRVEWPGFRGPGRDSIIRGVRIESDWSRTPPVELWRRPIGPGWSSFAVRNDRIYTQEQRGDDEVVSAYTLNSGEPVWRHRDSARFWESNAGAGPRATPTLSHGRVYTLGATGILNALDARNGARVWSRNAVSDTGAKIPYWGIASSPLVVGDVVIAATGGSLAAYDAATGNPRWFGPKGGSGYSSPHLATIDGVAQVVLVNGPGVIGVAPSDGTVLWKHAWGGDSIVQPAMLAGGDLLIGSGSGLADKTGLLRATVAHQEGRWIVKERWTTAGLKPYFNDFVVHKGHAFGVDGTILACIDLGDGKRKWKGGRYGNGQLVLLADQDLLLVLSEEGELALVSATPDKFTEVARFPALDGKTWNHPVLVGDVLLVRNGEEMAAFRLSLAGVD